MLLRLAPSAAFTLQQGKAEPEPSPGREKRDRSKTSGSATEPLARCKQKAARHHHIRLPRNAAATLFSSTPRDFPVHSLPYPQQSRPIPRRTRKRTRTCPPDCGRSPLAPVPVHSPRTTPLPPLNLQLSTTTVSKPVRHQARAGLPRRLALAIAASYDVVCAPAGLHMSEPRG